MIMIGPPPPETSTRTSNSVNTLVHGILSYDGNIMLAAIISLLLVILFVLLLHVYAKWFLVQARQRSRRSVSVPQVLGARFHHFHSFTIDTTFAESPTKGLESSVISKIPAFVYKVEDQLKHGLECAICLSLFEDEEVGRRLPKCTHAFHVECIDMWLHSHSTCPICRAPVAAENQIVDTSSLENDEVILNYDLNDEPSTLFVEEMSNQDSLLEIIVEVPKPENENVSPKDSVSVCSLSPSSVSSHGRPFSGDSIKKIMSKNRSERKVHPSTSVNEPDV